MALQLPPLPRRGDLLAFWLVIATVAGLATGIALALLTSRVAGLLAPLPFAAIAIPAPWCAPRFVERVYRAWNRLAGIVVRVIRAGATASAYAIVTAVGWLGSPLPWNAPYPAGSGWVPRKALEAGSFTGPSAAAGDAQGLNWLSALLRSTRGAGHAWVWALVPSLVLLAAVESSARTSLQRDTYTLY